MSERRIRRVSTDPADAKDPEKSAWLVLKDADEPCVLFTPQAHGGHEQLTGNQLFEESLLVPVSLLMDALGLSGRVASLDQWMTQFTLDNHGRVLPPAEEMAALEKRLAALEEERTARPEAEDKALGLGDAHRFDHLRSNAANVQMDQMVESFGSIEAAAEALEKSAGGGDFRHSPLTRIVLDHLPIYEAEVEGLDRQGFRDLVRERLRVIWDALMAEWERKANADDV